MYVCTIACCQLSRATASIAPLRCQNLASSSNIAKIYNPATYRLNLNEPFHRPETQLRRSISKTSNVDRFGSCFFFFLILITAPTSSSACRLIEHFPTARGIRTRRLCHRWTCPKSLEIRKIRVRGNEDLWISTCHTKVESSTIKKKRDVSSF